MKAKDKDFVKYTVMGAVLGFAVTQALNYFVNKRRENASKMNTP